MANEKTPLWNGMEIPIIVLAAEINAGKSLFPLYIDPACRLPKEEAEPTTISFDQEGSAQPYKGSLNFRWFDTRAAVFNGVHRNVVAAGPNDPKWLRILKTKADVNDSPAASMFRAAYLSLLSIEAGKYRVMAFDTFTPIQDGMVEWLRAHPEAFGRTANQYEKASSMFLWPDVKAMLGHILAVDCRMRFETVVLNVHMKAKWEGDKKTRERIAEGLDILEKLATLYIQLERKPDAQGNVPKVPVGILKKQRLLRFGQTPDDDQPILPPRIEHCTPDTIRAWIAKPADYAKLKKAERVIVEQPTEIELQQMRLATAEAEAEAANAKTILLERQRELAAIRQAAQATAPQKPDQTAAARKAAEEKREATAKEAAQAAAKAAADLAATQAEGQRLAAAAEAEHRKPDPTTAAAAGAVSGTTAAPKTAETASNGQSLAERFKAAFTASGVSPDRLKAAFAASGCERFTQCSETRQAEILAWLDDLAACQSLVQALGLDEAKVKQLCARAGVERIADLNGPVAAMLRSTLQKALDGREAAAKN